MRININTSLVFLFAISTLSLRGSEESPKSLENIFSHLADRMYCISEVNGNSQNEIEKELDKSTKEIEEIFNSQAIMPDDNRGAFFGAAACGNKEIIKMFIGKGFDVEEDNEAGQTVIMVAAMWGNIETLQALIDAGANLEAKDKNGRSVGYFAMFVPNNYQIDMFSMLPKFLIANARYKDRDPFTACKEIIIENKKIIKK